MRRVFPQLLLALLALPVVAQPTDRSGPLHSTQIRFDDDNVPVITIGIMDEQKDIAFTTRGALTILPEGPGGTEMVVRSERRWTVRLEGASPARLVWRAILQTVDANDLEAVQAARAGWAEREVEIHPVELGSVFGFFGKVMDTRKVVLTAVETHESREAAEAAATQLAAKHEVAVSVMPHVLERASGTLVMTDGAVTVRARDVIWIEPQDEVHTTTVHQVEFGRGFPWHAREDRSYRGTLYVTVDPSGRLAVAAMIPAEKLLEGLVPAEIYPSAPDAALRAQAVSARAEVLAKIGLRHLADPFLICSDVHCQVYAGTKREDDRTTRAVRATRGQMLFHEGELVDTVYSASCGGHTEHNEHVWGTPPDPSLRGRPDGEPTLGEPTEEAVRAWVTSAPATHCGSTRLGASSYRWNQRVAVDVIRRGMQAQNNDVGVPRAIKVLRRGVSGRAIAVEVRGTLGRKTVIEGELNIRKAFGGLKSSLFVVDSNPGPSGHPVNFRFTGGGFGHGVGMCQTGAIGMAEAGKSFREILSHYYGGAVVERIY